ncbi:MAG: serine hydrolase [Cyanobacteria bacterium J06636_16]
MIVALVLTLLCAWMPMPAIAAPPIPPVAIAQTTILPPNQALERLFQPESVQNDWFMSQFLEQIPLGQVQALLDSLKQSMGSLQTITPIANGYELTFERGIVPAQIRLNDQGQIAGLFFGPPEAPISVEEAVSSLGEFPGEASLLVLADDEVLADVQADEPLAVGSAFKLAVLVALKEAIAQGTLNWDDVVTLQPEWRSLPGGILQDWPAGTALTVETLATLMISVSDNTATDALIQILGREPIEAIAPRNQPLLTTREFFALKNPDNADTLRRFRQANTVKKRQLLDSLESVALPDASLFTGNPIALDVEWSFSAHELCDLIAQVQDLPLMSVNPGVARLQDWQTVNFKGGSEPGVLNLTTQLEAADGRTYCVAATWNDPDQPVDEETLFLFYRDILLGLAG